MPAVSLKSQLNTASVLTLVTVEPATPTEDLPFSPPLMPAPSSTLPSDESSYDTSDESDSDDESPTTQNPSEREAERMRVLEAAGITFSKPDANSPKRPTRMPRRKAPLRPDRPSTAAAVPTLAEPVEPEESAEDHEERMEDAYDVRSTFLFSHLDGCYGD